MSIILKYPKIEGNELCDGLLHDIQPKKISRIYINDSEFYLLDYFDEKYKCDSFTILREEGYSFTKVPLKNLKDYQILLEKIHEGKIKLEEVNLSILNRVKIIFTDEPLNSINDLNVAKRVSKEVNRREQIDLSIKMFEDAIEWQGRIPIMPEYVRIALSRLKDLDLESLPSNTFNLLIERLRDGLNRCVTSRNGGTIILGEADVDFGSAVKIIYNLIDQYFNKKYTLPAEENSEYKVAKVDFRNPPPPPPYNPEQPNYLSEKFNSIYIHPSSQYRNAEIPKENIKIQFYVALDNTLYDSDKIPNFLTYSFEDNNYENIENKLSFYPNYNSYNRVLFDYLIKVKKGECMLISPLRITLDIENKCYYLGGNNKVKGGIFLDYNFAICDTKDKFDEISGKDISINIREDCPYRHISRESFVSKTFKFGVEGGYTLSTYCKTFEGDLNKINYWPFEEKEDPKNKK